MRTLLILFLFFALSYASRFYIENSLSPLDMNLPFDSEGKGRFKAQVRNFNPGKTAKFCAKGLAAGLTFFCIAIDIAALQVGSKVHFPVIAGKTQVPNGDKWKKIDSKRGKYSFEYHHRCLNKYCSQLERGYFKNNPKHYKLYQDSKSQKLGFYFYFSDQAPKIFKTLKARLPFHWSGYELKWWARFNDHEQEISAPLGQDFKEINLINFFNTNDQLKFSFHAQFVEKELIEKPNDIDLLTLDYQMIPIIDFNSDQIELLFSDGIMNIPKIFIKEYLPSIEMISRHEKDSVIDLRESPVTKNIFEILQNFVQMTFNDISSTLEQNSPEELVNLLLAFDYLMVPTQYIEVVTDMLKSKMTLENSYQILTQLPNDGLLLQQKKVLDQRFKSLFDEQYKKGNLLLSDNVGTEFRFI